MDLNSLPQRSSLKSKHVRPGRQNLIRETYDRAMRRSEKRWIFEVDPYAEVFQIRDNVFALLTDVADSGATVWSYLINGPDKALLIDTSFGIGDLKSLVNILADGRPIVLANTHPSYDHSFGNCQFDKAYFQEFAQPKNEAQFHEHMWDYLFNEDGTGKWLDFDRNDIIKFRPYEVEYVPNGYIFNLGGDYDVELVWLPGHHAGHCGFLDKKGRMLIAGDVAIAGGISIGRGFRQDSVYGQYCTVEALRDEYTKLIARTDEFDSVCPGHGMIDMPPYILNAIYDTLNKILEDPNGYERSSSLLQGSGIEYAMVHRSIPNIGSIGYTLAGVYMNTEAK